MRMRWCVGLTLVIVLSAGVTWAQESQKPVTLEESIRIALDRNLKLHSSMEGVVGAEFRRKAAQTDFLAKWTGQYGYTFYNSPITVGYSAITLPTGKVINTDREIFNLSTTVTQPLFAGGSILANYRNEKLGVDVSQMDVETVKREIVLQVREGYFNILRAEKFLDVARQTVKQFSAQLEVTKAFFEVGIVPKNDVLQAEVRLANARQGLVKAENDVVLAKSSFNSLLRNEINAFLQVVDILGYSPFSLIFEDSLKEALEKRPEIRTATLKIEQAKEGVKIAKSGFFPTVNLSGNYSRLSDEPLLIGGHRGERWTVQGVATITLGDWGKTAHKVGESKVKVTQAEDAKAQLIDGITLEVKNNYQIMLVAEKNISVAQKAIEQAEENLRMNEERYKHQVATATDVLDAVTLLAQARVNYYGALSDFNVAKARLERSMGRMYP
ncbi:MAG: TolC family protein [Deltaproteobacteria bacterium]|nr:TolC family protein [Deltaproteobacteria bacterium]MBM4324942.1 TolC family protein [Deltaproteobacteria bacterium]